MKTNIYLFTRKTSLSFFKKPIFKGLLGLGMLFSSTNLNAQSTLEPQYVAPSWWFGLAAGANFNFYEGSTQKLDANLTLPAAFHNGNGIGLFLGPLMEYHAPESRWGFMLQALYDNRSGSFKSVNSPCNCPMDLSTKLSYISVEPSLRFAPFKSNFYLFAGPRVAFLLDNSYTYQLNPNPDYPEQIAEPEVKGSLSEMNPTLISLQIGTGYDIQLSSASKQTKYVLSPFISFQPYFGQNPRSIETWNMTTLRGGVAFKFGRGHASDPIVEEKIEETSNVPVVPIVPINFIVKAPANVPTERRVRETFPIRNYVFFDLGSTKIPSRYVTLNKNQVKDFKEDQLEVFTPKRLSGRNSRQLVAYYNILNIVGDRMIKEPSAQIVLIGASEKGEKDALAMSNSIKTYLVNIWGIAPNRITLEGRDKPKKPSEQPGGTKELVLLREGDRRVTIESNSTALLMEFRSGPDVPLKPVELNATQEAPIDSYVSFNVEGAKENFKSWRLEARDANGKVQYFGPYTQSKISIPGKTILGNKPEGNYDFKMIGTTKSGATITKLSSAHLVLWKPTKDEQGMRYSIIFDFNESDAALKYEKYLTEKVVPKIPIGGTVILHGHTDLIGDKDNNLKLSEARTKEVRDLLEKELKRIGRTDVKFEEYAFGEDDALSPFENNYPEERFYNRTVIIDIIPKK